jgi:hypothetical protein
MAMKKSTPKPSGNPGGRTSQKISPSVTILGSKLKGFDGLPNGPRKSLTPKQLAEAKALADRIKAKEVKAANEKKANAKIIKKQNKTPLKPSGPTRPIRVEPVGTKQKPVVKVKPPKGGRGMGGFGGGLFGTKNR